MIANSSQLTLSFHTFTPLRFDSPQHKLTHSIPLKSFSDEHTTTPYTWWSVSVIFIWHLVYAFFFLWDYSLGLLLRCGCRGSTDHFKLFESDISIWFHHDEIISIFSMVFYNEAVLLFYQGQNVFYGSLIVIYVPVVFIAPPSSLPHYFPYSSIL